MNQNCQIEFSNTSDKYGNTRDIKSLMDTFATDLKRFKIHCFNIANQMDYYRKTKENLQPNEAFTHVDFAENFQCKLSNEIQSMHFGASKKQITLHTGVCYTTLSSETFCAVSDSLEHSPSSVWAFIVPLLDKTLKENPTIDRLIFFSDGPASQHKQKGNFLLFTKEMASRNVNSEWNFHESGHGKGVPELVLHGVDITNAQTFVENMKNSSVFVYEIGQKTIDDKTVILSKEKMKPVPGTMKLHQIKYTGYGEILYRDVICVCSEGSYHTEHQMKHHCLIDRKAETNSYSKIPNDKFQNETETKHEKSKDTKKEEIKPVQTKHQPKIIGDSATRKAFFSEMLVELGQCQTFSDIKEKCVHIHQLIDEKRYTLNFDFSPFIMNEGIEVDENTLLLCPSDIPRDTTLYPVMITADGNCLPYSGSVTTSGNEDMGEEMRVRIITESCIHKESYLNQTFLERGTDNPMNDSLAKTYAFYSDEYSDEALSDGQIERIYEKEIMKICKNKSYMGIWQIFALSSVLCRRIFSVYPLLGNPNVRKDLHGLVKPREERSAQTSYIMWTTTRQDMSKHNWIPNHFVTMLPMDRPNTKISVDESVKDIEIRNVMPETEDKQETKANDSETNHHESENIECKSELNETTENIRSHFDISDLSPQDLLGKFVLVSCDNKPYPGIVTDCDEAEVYVSCMHRVGRSLENSSFYWPLAVRDECWYDMENVIGTIPEPKLVGQKYCVDSELWALALQKLKK